MAKKPRQVVAETTGADEGGEAKATSNGSVRIKPDLAYKLRIICEADQTTAAAYLDPLIRGPIECTF